MLNAILFAAVKRTSEILCSRLLKLTQPALAAFGDPANKPLYKLPTIFADKNVRVVSDANLSQVEGKWIVGVVEDAIDFDTKAMALNKEDVFKKGFCVAILSTPYLTKKLHSELGGETLELDLIEVCQETYEKDKERFAVVIAHEMTHALVYRMFGTLNPRLLGWSRPWDEGFAQTNENRFALAMHKRSYPTGHIKIRQGDRLLTIDDAVWLFKQEKLVAIKKGYELNEKDQQRWAGVVYPLGRELIEFIRVNLNGHGYPDVVVKISQVVAEMGKRHRKFDVVFQEKFGIDYPSVQRQFIDHLRKTQNNMALRFKNSMFTP